MKFNKTAFFSSLFCAVHLYSLQSFAQEVVRGEYLVKIDGAVGLTATAAVFENQGFKAETVSSEGQLLLVKGVSTLQDLKKHSFVEYVEPNHIVHAEDLPDDPKLKNQWGLKNKNGTDVHAEALWRHSVAAKNVVVAVVDTGVAVNHPDLKENIWANNAEANGQLGVDDDGNGFVDDVHGFHFAYPKSPVGDKHGHGSHCAGIIAASGNNGVGVSGLLWQTQIMAVGFLDSKGSGTDANAIKAIDYAVKMGANVISASWGGTSVSQSVREAIARAGKAGVVFVAAAGNDGKDNDKRPHYPSSYDLPNIIGVAAVTRSGAKAGFSNYGAKSVHIGAPGENILSTLNSGYGYLSGTSMATPFVSAAAAMMLENHPDYSPEKVRAVLMNTATPLKSLQGKVKCAGLLNAEGTL